MTRPPYECECGSTDPNMCFENDPIGKLERERDAARAEAAKQHEAARVLMTETSRLASENERLRALAVRLRHGLTIAHDSEHGGGQSGRIVCGTCRLLADPEVEAL